MYTDCTQPCAESTGDSSMWSSETQSVHLKCIETLLPLSIFSLIPSLLCCMLALFFSSFYSISSRSVYSVFNNHCTNGRCFAINNLVPLSPSLFLVHHRHRRRCCRRHRRHSHHQMCCVHFESRGFACICFICNWDSLNSNCLHHWICLLQLYFAWIFEYTEFLFALMLCFWIVQLFFSSLSLLLLLAFVFLSSFQMSTFYGKRGKKTHTIFIMHCIIPKVLLCGQLKRNLWLMVDFHTNPSLENLKQKQLILCCAIS